MKHNKYEKFLKMKIDTKLNFIEDLNDMISKTSYKVNTLLKVKPYIP